MTEPHFDDSDRSEAAVQHTVNLSRRACRGPGRAAIAEPVVARCSGKPRDARWLREATHHPGADKSRTATPPALAGVRRYRGEGAGDLPEQGTDLGGVAILVAHQLGGEGLAGAVIDGQVGACATYGRRARRVSPPGTRRRRRLSGPSRRSPRAPARSAGPGPATRRAPGRDCAARTSCGRARRHQGRAGSQASAADPRFAARADQRPDAAGGRSRSPGPHTRAGDRTGPYGADASALGVTQTVRLPR